MSHQAPDYPNNVSPRSTAFSRGKFGRLFPALPPQCYNEPNIYLLNMLARRMVRVESSAGKSKVPAGYTYFGQFIAHDMSFDPTTIGERTTDPEFLWNFRTPALDLDSVYGGGPALTPYLYDDDWKFIVSYNGSINSVQNLSLFDFQRNSNGTAIIVDPRNDENMILSRIHLIFQLLHNHFMNQNESSIPNKKQRFEKAKKETIWHYQWIILYDYLPRIIGPDFLNDLLNLGMSYEKGRKYYDWRNEPFLPIEFAAAAFRFGHTQIRDKYRIGNEKLGNFKPSDSGSQDLDLRLKTKFPAPIDLRAFFFDQKKSITGQNFAHKIEPKIASALSSVSKFKTPENSDLNNNMDFLQLLFDTLEQKGYKKLFGKKLDNNQIIAIWNDILDTVKTDQTALSSLAMGNRLNNIRQERIGKPQNDSGNNLIQIINDFFSEQIFDEARNEIQTFQSKEMSKYIPHFENLAFRTLLKGCQMSLPSGQSVANLIGAKIEPVVFEDLVLPTSEASDKKTIEANQEITARLQEAFGENTPLWYYILHEAKDLEAPKTYSQRLGKVGATIVGEVIIGLIDGDDDSFLSQHRTWKPNDLKKEIPDSPKSITDILDLGDESRNFTMRNIIDMLESDSTLLP